MRERPWIYRPAAQQPRHAQQAMLSLFMSMAPQKAYRLSMVCGEFVARGHVFFIHRAAVYSAVRRKDAPATVVLILRARLFFFHFASARAFRVFICAAFIPYFAFDRIAYFAAACATQKRRCAARDILSEC